LKLLSNFHKKISKIFLSYQSQKLKIIFIWTSAGSF